jgi:hypothetical protein
MPRATLAARHRSTKPTLDLNKRFNTPIESMKIEFRAEAYNIFNHTNLYLPSHQRFAAHRNANSGHRGNSTERQAIHHDRKSYQRRTDQLPPSSPAFFSLHPKFTF